MQAELRTYGAALVGRVEIPPFKKLPEVLVWGSRTFVLAGPGEGDGVPVYAEGCAFHVTGDLLKDEAAAETPAAPFPELQRVPTGHGEKVSTSGRIVDLHGPAPDPETDATGQHKGYWVLSPEERAKGLVRPVRRSYRHVGPPGPKHVLRELTAEEQERYAGVGYIRFEPYPESELPRTGRYWTREQLNAVGRGCGSVTTMGTPIAETYARDPTFYGSTFCCACGKHLPVGEQGEFVWEGTEERVGA